MKYCSNVSPIMRSQENGIVSAAKEIIETYVAARRYYNFPKRIIENTTTRVTNKTMSKITVKWIN